VVDEFISVIAYELIRIQVIKQVKKIKKKLKENNRLSEIKGKTFKEVLNMQFVKEAKNYENFIEIIIVNAKYFTKTSFICYKTVC
jgi:hypothetical protein